MNKRKKYIIYCLNFVLCCIYAKGFSQTVRATVDRNKIRIGEQIKLKLSVEQAHAGITWFQILDSVNHLEVVERSKIDTVLNGAVTNYYQTISITSFDSGRWEFPSLYLPNINKTTAPFSIDVMPVDVSNMQDYNDIKDIEEVKQENNWLIVGIIAAVTLLSIAMIIWLIKKKRTAVVTGALRSKLSPLDWALAELGKLDGQNLNTAVQIKKYYSDLTNISRTFFNMQLQQHSLQQTTDEWMVALQALSVDNNTKTSFFQFLRLADTVKFAKFLPASNDNVMSVEAIKAMLQKVSLLHSDLYSNYQPK